MSKINEIAKLMNGVIDKLNIAVDADLIGLTTHIPNESGKLLPCITKDGESQYITVEDLYSLRLYHRLDGVSVTSLPNTGRGDRGNDKQSVYNAAVYVILNTEKLNVEEVAEILLDKININLSSSQNQKINTRSSVINSTGVVFQSKLNDLFNSEFGLLSNELLPKITMLKVSYTATLISRDGCLSLCENKDTCLN